MFGGKGFKDLFFVIFEDALLDDALLDDALLDESLLDNALLCVLKLGENPEEVLLDNSLIFFEFLIVRLLLLIGSNASSLKNDGDSLKLYF